MREIVMEIVMDTLNYTEKAFEFCHIRAVVFVALLNYIIFPSESYVPAVFALSVTLFVDIVTKYYAVGSMNGGFVNALRTGALSSNRLWVGTQRKLVGYSVLLILCGLAVRVTAVTSIAVILFNITFTVMFIREAQSCVENLIDAGHDYLDWFLFLIKRRRKEIEDSAIEGNGSTPKKAEDVKENISEEEEGGDYSDRI